MPDGDRVRVRRISPTGSDLPEAPLPALVVATQALGEPAALAAAQIVVFLVERRAI